MDAVFNDRQYLGELWRDQLVSFCRSHPVIAGASGPVDVSAACNVLAAWDLHDNLDSRGALLFRRFASRALAVQGGPFATPFSASDPVNTPRDLNTNNPQVQQALADAVTDLQGAGLALDAPLAQAQYERRGAAHIPIHGGPGTVGVFNAINVTWDPKNAYAGIPHGSSYVQVVHLTGAECPDAHTILTYSLSVDPTSRWYADQTRMFSRKEWVRFPFCAADIASDPQLQITNLGGGYGQPGASGQPCQPAARRRRLGASHRAVRPAQGRHRASRHRRRSRSRSCVRRPARARRGHHRSR
jgi:acyl-homoserine-lactone acylase